MKDLVRRAVAPGLTTARGRFGSRQINWMTDFLGFGNQLDLWAWPTRAPTILSNAGSWLTAKMRYWAELFPEVAARYLIEPSDVRLLDQRDHFWAKNLEHSDDRRGFTDASREAFVRDCLLPAPLFADLAANPLASDDTVVLNVRRGRLLLQPALSRRTRHRRGHLSALGRGRLDRPRRAGAPHPRGVGRPGVVPPAPGAFGSARCPGHLSRAGGDPRRQLRRHRGDPSPRPQQLHVSRCWARSMATACTATTARRPGLRPSSWRPTAPDAATTTTPIGRSWTSFPTAGSRPGYSQERRGPRTR